MTSWLAPVDEALSRLNRPVTVFIRDDDAGWADERLFALLACCQRLDVPIDLAAIPVDMNSQLATRLRELMLHSMPQLGVHQHGYQHCNRETEGRKCEFGQARSYRQQLADIQAGQKLLAGYFGELLDPFFTPPWNRCSQDTVRALQHCGIRVLSRDSSAAPLDPGSLTEIPVTLDWFKKKHGVRLEPQQMAGQLAEQLGHADTVGIMLHHALMDDAELARLETLIRCLQASDKIIFSSLRMINKRKITTAQQPDEMHY